MRLALALLLTLILLAGVAWAFAAWLGAAGVVQAASAIALLLAFAALLSALGQVVATVLDPDPMRARGANAGVVWARELGHFLWCFFLAQPLLSWLMARTKVPHKPRAVVVFAHGFLCNRGLWWCWRSAWHRAGFVTVVLDLPPFYWSPEHNRKQLQDALQQAAERFRLPLCVVGHSMGGMIGRMQLCTAEPEISALVSLGAPFQGTLLAGQMGGLDHGPPVPHSPWMLAFNQRFPPVHDHRCVNFWSANDCIVVPASSCTLAALHDRPKHHLGHMGLCQSKALCLEALAAADRLLWPEMAQVGLEVSPSPQTGSAG